jgi:hypothetical protein
VGLMGVGGAERSTHEANRQELSVCNLFGRVALVLCAGCVAAERCSQICCQLLHLDTSQHPVRARHVSLQTDARAGGWQNKALSPTQCSACLKTKNSPTKQPNKYLPPSKATASSSKPEGSPPNFTVTRIHLCPNYLRFLL